jgi:hypothetical protein
LVIVNCPSPPSPKSESLRKSQRLPTVHAHWVDVRSALGSGLGGVNVSGSYGIM